MSVPTIMNAEQLTCFIESHLRDVITEPNLAEFPWESTLSDHMPVFMITAEKKIMSWNLLNPRFLKHLQPSMCMDSKSPVDFSQRLSHSVLALESHGQLRESMQVDYISNKIDDGYIVCLQEVSPHVLAQIKTYFMDRNASMAEDDDNVVGFGFHVNEVSASGQDMNVTMWDSKRYEVDMLSVMDARDCGLDGGQLSYVTLTNKEAEKDRFAVVNVHIKYHCNKQYACMLLKTFLDLPTMPVYVCGDFNCSARSAIPNCSDAVERIAEAYADPAFEFAVPSAPYFSHVNKFQNTLSTARMLDKFDYIMIMNKQT